VKRLLALVAVSCIVVIVVVAIAAMGMTRYSATFEWEGEIGRSLLYDLNTLDDPNVSYSKTTFWDYLLPGKGHSGILYTEGFVLIYVNVTDSSGSVRSGYVGVNWNASDPSTYPEILQVKVLGLVKGPAEASITYHFYNEVTETMNYHLYRYAVIPLQVG
jgi:hypothetical protein